MSARKTAALAALTGSVVTSDAALDVVLELTQPEPASEGNRGERIARQKAFFESVAQSVKAAVVQSGGTVEGEAWINCTIKARVPASAIDQLAKVDGIVTIDLPRRIERE